MFGTLCVGRYLGENPINMQMDIVCQVIFVGKSGLYYVPNIYGFRYVLKLKYLLTFRKVRQMFVLSEMSAQVYLKLLTEKTFNLKIFNKISPSTFSRLTYTLGR